MRVHITEQTIIKLQYLTGVESKDSTTLVDMEDKVGYSHS